MMLYRLLPDNVILRTLQAFWKLPLSDQEWLVNNVKVMTHDYDGSYEDQVAISTGIVRLNMLVDDRKRKGPSEPWTVIRKWLDMSNAVVRNNSVLAAQIEKEFEAMPGTSLS